MCNFLIQSPPVSYDCSICVFSHFSRVPPFATLWTIAHQAPLLMGFSRQEYWNGLPFPSPGVLSHPAIKTRSPSLQADSFLFEPSTLHQQHFGPLASFPGAGCVQLLGAKLNDKNLSIDNTYHGILITKASKLEIIRVNGCS